MTRRKKSYADKVFFEYLTHAKTKEAVVILSGFPSSYYRKYVMKYLHEKGYNVFYPRFLGNYQSKGKFLEQDPSKTIREFIEYLEKGKTDNLWTEQKDEFANKEYILLSGSFSGAISFALADHNRISRIVSFSPVWDYEEHNEDGDEQDIGNLTDFVERSYKNLYRFDFDNVDERMQEFESCRYESYKDDLKHKDVTIVHDPDDEIVRIRHSRQKGKEVGAELIEMEFGHGYSLEDMKRANKKFENPL